MRRYLTLAFIGTLIGLLLAISVACTDQGPTAPDPVVQHEQVDYKTLAATPAPAIAPDTPASPADEASGKWVKIGANGSVSTGENFSGGTACVYSYKEYTQQSFSHSYRVAGKGATTAFQSNKAWECGMTITFQLDVQRGTTCPADPFSGAWDGGLVAGKSGITYKTEDCIKPTPTPPPPPNCIPVWNELPPVYGEWGECKKQPHDVSRSCKSDCHSYRTVTINEKNSCTAEVRIKRTYEESRDCPCPKSGCEAATSSAPNPFSLPNAGEATETTWANNNVNGGDWEFLFKKDGGFTGSCSTSEYNAAIVLVKAGTKWKYYLNVLPGEQLCSSDGKTISHITYFVCAD